MTKFARDMKRIGVCIALATDYLMPARRYNEAADNLMLLDRMQNHVEQHRAGAEPNDDLTMMCLNLKL